MHGIPVGFTLFPPYKLSADVSKINDFDVNIYSERSHVQLAAAMMNI